MLTKIKNKLGTGVANTLIFWAALLLLLPLVSRDAFTMHLFSLVAINAMVALGLQLLLGFSGQLSIGQAAFYGIGAYASAILTTVYGLNFVIALLVAGIVSSVISLLMVPITRLSGVYLAVSTIGFSILTHLVMKNEEWLTGGTLGLIGIPRPSFFGYILKDPVYIYYLCASFLILVLIILKRLQSSRFGRAINAIRQNEDAARSCGVEITKLKSQCFIIAAFITGLAGALYAHEVRYLAPDDFTFWKSIEFLFMVVIGGVGSLSGAVLGAAFVVILPEVLREIGDYRMLVFGGMIILVMLLGEAGLAGFARSFANRITSMFRR